jgi:hypothetical protein
MFHKKIETTADAVEFLQGGKKANEILERLEMLENLIEQDSQQETEEVLPV